VHLLRAEMGGKRDEAIFDLSFTRATLRFRPPTRMETVVTQAGAGFLRALEGAAQVLFLVALALAVRSRQEWLALAAMFLAGQVFSVVVVPQTSWQPAPRFVEAAAALTVAYLSVEILLLPKAGARWAIAGVLGIFHGLYFHLFVQTTGYSPALVLAGAAAAEISALAVLALAFHRLRRWTPVFAAALLLFGVVWFLLRLRG
jgi:HupE / UreJ protein